MTTKNLRGLRLLAAVTALGVGAPVWAMQGSSMEGHMAESHQEGPTRLSSGQFQGLAHETSGSASVYQLADGRRVLRLEELHTSDGPDLRVYLVRGDDATDKAAIQAGHFIDLGALKGNVGNLNYDIPQDVDLSQYRSVSIWCRRFGVNFAAAPLALEAR